MRLKMHILYICRKIQDFTPCNTLIDAIANDRKYTLITDTLQNSAFDIGEDHSHPAFEFRKQWDRMSILLSGETKIAVVDGILILVPIAARASIVDLLHEGHPGLVRMQKCGSELYFWPDMVRDIETRVKNCPECNLLKASKPKHHMSPESALSPMSHVGVDLFSEKGSTYLVCACRYSGYFFVDQLRSLTTKAVLTKLSKWFLTFGLPLVIRSDGGPQFRSQFSTFCQERNIKHELSSAYNPTSNSLAESTVNQAKHFLKRSVPLVSNFSRNLLPCSTHLELMASAQTCWCLEGGTKSNFYLLPLKPFAFPRARERPASRLEQKKGNGVLIIRTGHRSLESHSILDSRSSYKILKLSCGILKLL